GPGASHHGRKALQRLVDRGVDVVLVEGLGGGGEHRDLLHPDRAGTLVAFFVGNQYRVMHARSAGDAGIDLGGVGQLRHPLRADEAGRLDAPQPGGGEAVDQGDLVGGGDRRLLVLQPVARADLDDADRRLHAASAFSSATSTASASMKSPAAARTSATVPARGAFKLSSIFIASITISSWPASTTSPAATRATTTRPGIGASTRSVAAPAAVPAGWYSGRGSSCRRSRPSCTSTCMPASRTCSRTPRPSMRALRTPSARRAPSTACSRPASRIR